MKEEIYILVSKYLTGEATIEEQKKLLNWRRASSENEIDFQDLKFTLKNTEIHLNQVVPDKEFVWQQIMSHISLKVRDVKRYSIRTFYTSLGAVACFALLLGFAFAAYFQSRGIQQTKEVVCRAPMGQKAELILPDGSHVILNSGSTLTYNTDFSSSNRSVKLEGEGFFDVVKDKENQFDVSVGSIKVVVHGTSFNVEGYPDDKNIEVALLEGHVSVYSSSNKLLADMRPDQKLIVEGGERAWLTDCVAAEEALWRLGKLKIQGESLQDVVRKLEKWYGVNILLEGDMDSKHRVWMTIRTETLRETLDIINRITPIDYSINGEEVHIVSR